MCHYLSPVASFPRCCLLSLLVITLLNIPASAGERTAVALTTTVHRANGDARQDLVGKFLALLEFRVSQSPTITVVERMQLDLALQQLVLSRGLGSNARQAPRLGKLVSADLILNAQFLPPDENGDVQRTLIRIVEAKTGAIRGITVATIDELTIDDLASHVARYLSAVIESPAQAAVTVAVGAFESEGRFVRLRPLELGIRDMLTTDLVNVSRFRVLQRSSMEDLLRELDLIQAGLVDQSDLPDTLPSRAAAYLVTGTLNEQNADGKYTVSVEGTITHASSNNTVHNFKFVAAPDKLPEALSKNALQIAEFLTRASNLPEGKLHQPSGRNETQLLLDQVLVDLHRFRRRSPIHGASRDFEVPGFDPWRDGDGKKFRTVVTADSTLGKHLLRKSIDRLETILFIEPDHVVAAYALAFCLAHHIEGIGDPARGATLLRRVYESQPESELAVSALTLMAAISRHHTRGLVIPVAPELSSQSVEQVRFAFENMPPAHRGHYWSRMLELLHPRYLPPKEIQSLASMLPVVLKMIDQAEGSTKRNLIKEAAVMASSLNTPEGQELLARWARSDDKLRRHAGCLRLAIAARAAKDDVAAAGWYEQAADGFVGSDDSTDRYNYENLLVYAAKHYRRANQFDSALRVLDSFEPSLPNSLNRGYHDLELGICLAARGENEKALELWVDAAEAVPNLSYNSDVRRRIDGLGGVPLDQNRQIDVRYLANAKKQPAACQVLATDGSRLFCGSNVGGSDLLAFDIETESWTTIKQDIGKVTALACADGVLWVGTDKHGLWRCHLVGAHWRHWGRDEGLPDLHIESINVDQAVAYVGVGSTASGGLARIAADDSLDLFEGPSAPKSAPTHVVVRDDRIFARTLKSILKYSLDDKKWTRLPRRTFWNPAIFAGQSGIWGSRQRKELFPFEQSTFAHNKFKQAWFPSGRNKGGYYVKFLIEREDEIWFGGTPWEKSQTTGLYRVNKRTGEFFMYGPRDGFKTSVSYATTDGVWASDRLWLATPNGLAEVTWRERTASPHRVP